MVVGGMVSQQKELNIKTIDKLSSESFHLIVERKKEEGNNLFNNFTTVSWRKNNESRSPKFAN